MSRSFSDIANHPVLRMFYMVVMIYVGFGLLLTLGQRAFIYYPTPEVKMQGITSEIITNQEATIKIDVVNPGQSRALVYFGGNAEAVAFNAPAFRQVFPDHTLYLMNYRGYGGSSGKPDELSLYADALALYDHVEARHAGISAIGRSLGSGVASYLASKRSLDRLVLVTPFDSIERVAAGKYPVYPVSIMLWDKYDSISRVPEISAKTLIIIAANDRIIPAKHGRKLAAAFPSEQMISIELDNEGHNSLSDNPRYYLAMQQFLDSTVDLIE